MPIERIRREQHALILGARGSALAMAQIGLARAMLRKAHPKLEIEIRVIKTRGDIMPTASLARGESKGLFIRELEQALLRRKIDVAVHSLKDLPTELPAGLMLAAVSEREDTRDILIALSVDALRAPPIVLTSSPRRAFQAKLLWPDCETREIRGNVETRLRKLAEAGKNHTLVLAVAGLRRLDLLRGDQDEGVFFREPHLFYRKLSLDEMLPAPGQAALGFETRATDGITQERLRLINHFVSWSAVTAERAFLQALGGGCAMPIAACASVSPEGMRLRGLVFDKKGNPCCGETTPLRVKSPWEGWERVWRGEKTGSQREAENLGKALAQEYLKTKGQRAVEKPGNA